MDELMIHGLPHAEAFNPGMIEWQGRILLLYRVGGWDHAQLHLGELDQDFQPVGAFHQVLIPGHNRLHDARFFTHNGQLYFSYVEFISPKIQRTGIGRIHDDLSVSECRLIEGTDPRVPEKNWIFFSHGDELLFTYAMSDGVHQVYRVVGDRCEPAYRTHYQNPWTWGIARGGTQLIRHQDCLYGFFHGTDYFHPGEERRYYVGAYAIALQPPFSLIKMSGAPLYTPPEPRLLLSKHNRPPRLVANIFPEGLVLRDQTWIICAGYNNQAIKLFRLSHEELTANLVSTTPPETDGRSPLSHPSRIHVHEFDSIWTQTIRFVLEKCHAAEFYYADARLSGNLPHFQAYEMITVALLKKGRSCVVLHKGEAQAVDAIALDYLKNHCQAVFANEVFVIFVNFQISGAPKVDRKHVDALWFDLKLVIRKAVPERNSFWKRVLKRVQALFLLP